jgi:hypothetical protein
VSEPTRPSLSDIALVLAHVSDRVFADDSPRLDPIVGASLRRATQELKRHIPGLDAPPDAAVAHFLEKSAAASLAHERHREALGRALRGLAHAPQDPRLHYIAGSACFELGETETALACIAHAVWVHPGFTDAWRDLEALSAFRDAARAEGCEDSSTLDEPLRLEWEDDDEERAA